MRSSPISGNYDEIFRKVEEHDDGFAKIVHTFQSDRDDIHDLADAGTAALRPVGIRLGWGHEQIVVWMNGSFRTTSAIRPPAATLPLAFVLTVDVRAAGAADPWSSLVRVSGKIAYAGIDLGHFDGELGVDATPT